MSAAAPTAQQYEMLEMLGSGNFGVVYKAIDLATGETVAIKHIDLETEDDEIAEVQTEIAMLSSCACPQITQYRTCFLRGSKLWIVMEYLGGGSGSDLLAPGPFNEAQVAIICREMLLGLDYLHREGKIHRDIKAANVLFSTSGKVKLADLGVSAQVSNLQSQRHTFVGSPFWMAPEIIVSAGHDFKADIWSLGITALEMINGEVPCQNMHPTKALFQIPKQPAPRLEGPQYSRDLKDFIAACLVKDPDRRSTARELLRHRFIRAAGRVETLRDLVKRRQAWRKDRNRQSEPKVYQETLDTMPSRLAQEGWDFDTVKVAPRKPSYGARRVSAIHRDDQENAENALQQLDLNAAPADAPASGYATTRRLGQTTSPSRLSASKMPAPNRKPSGGHKQPLVPDTSFGNGTSKAKRWMRVADHSPTTSPEASIAERDENNAPLPEAMTKEALLGRKLYSKVVDHALQETYAQTASQAKREAIARVAEAWSALDAVDPEGEAQIIRAIVNKLKITKVERYGTLTAIQQSVTDTAVPSEPTITSVLPPSSPAPSAKPKLVLAQNNPHLKSHLRRNSTQVPASDRGSQRLQDMPGGVKPGLEHINQLGDVLYRRWLGGIKSRWSRP
ncbi:MAG: hypothetical protein M1832_002877 [Thelocarpon impressellum]|nr:MAG: hypothetical protein M1832_002877 [Thelocarpon impressellum]